MKTLTSILLITVLAAATPEPPRFHVIRQWKYVNFTWPDEDTLKTYESKGLYVPENVVMAGVKYHDDFFYITLPRMKSGVPATLARIKAGHTRDTSPNLDPFPSWKMNSLEDCNSLQNVQNVEIDTKGQIWIIDGGRIHTLTQPVVKCSPKLVIYDIKLERVMTVYNFPEEVAPRNSSFLYDLVVDETDGGFAYITDNSARDPGIIVYSVKDNSSWKLRDQRTMSADHSATHFTVNQITISDPINIAAIALGPKVHTSDSRVIVEEDREVYFCPLSSQHLFSINTTSLRGHNRTANPNESIKDVGLKSSQTGSMVMDNQGVLYYSLLGNDAIGRWDSHTPFASTQRLIAQDHKYLEWPNSFTFDLNGNLTVLANSLNTFIYDKFDLDAYNFRLVSAFVGGKSYLYDDHFEYESGSNTTNHQNSTTSTNKNINSTVHEDHENKTSNNDISHQKHQATIDDSVKITPSSGSTLVASLFSLFACVAMVHL